MPRAKSTPEERKQRRLDRQRRWRDANREKLRKSGLDYYYANRTDILERAASPEVRAIKREYARKHYAETAETKRAYINKWREERRATQGEDRREAFSRQTRSGHYQRRYGMSIECVETMAAEQQGLCAICQTRAKLHVDHNHVSGAVRGLLCFPCNSALGFLREDVERMQCMIDYVFHNRERANLQVVSQIHHSDEMEN